jgi:hypothetical protein
MEDKPSLPILASDAEREQASEVLREASVEGRLTLDEFSQRVEQALAARTRDELAAVTRDLPVVALGSGVATGRAPVRTSVAVMGTVERRGFWRVDAASAAISVMGTVKLDLRGTVIPAAVVTIDAVAFMGTIEVIVPFGVEVELEGMAIMGTKELKLTGPPPTPGAPVVRINAISIMGSVIVRDRPGLGERIRNAIEERLSGRNPDPGPGPS